MGNLSLPSAVRRPPSRRLLRRCAPRNDTGCNMASKAHVPPARAKRLPRLPRLPRAERGGAKRGGAKHGGGGATCREYVLAVCSPPSAVHCRGLLRCWSLLRAQRGGRLTMTSLQQSNKNRKFHRFLSRRLAPSTGKSTFCKGSPIEHSVIVSCANDTLRLPRRLRCSRRQEEQDFPLCRHQTATTQFTTRSFLNKGCTTHPF